MKLSKINVYIFDLDGVIYRGLEPLPKAVETVKKLQFYGKEVWFLTNNSSSSRKEFVEKLSLMNISTTEERIISSGYATKLYLEKKVKSHEKLFIIGGEGLFDELKEFDVITYNSAITPNYVIVGLDRSLTYEKLEKAHISIYKGAKFIATNRDSNFPAENDLLLPGAGSIVCALEKSTGKRALVIGKPQSRMIDLIIEKNNYKRDEVLLVGDRVETDILCGKRANVKTALVLTGVTKKERAHNLNDKFRPDLLLTNLSELL